MGFGLQLTGRWLELVNKRPLATRNSPAQNTHEQWEEAVKTSAEAFGKRLEGRAIVVIDGDPGSRFYPEFDDKTIRVMKAGMRESMRGLAKARTIIEEHNALQKAGKKLEEFLSRLPLWKEFDERQDETSGPIVKEVAIRRMLEETVSAAKEATRAFRNSVQNIYYH